MPVENVHSEGGTKLLTVSWAEFSVATFLIILRVFTRLAVVKDGGFWPLMWALAAWVSI